MRSRGIQKLLRGLLYPAAIVLGVIVASTSAYACRIDITSPEQYWAEFGSIRQAVVNAHALSDGLSVEVTDVDADAARLRLQFRLGLYVAEDEPVEPPARGEPWEATLPFPRGFPFLTLYAVEQSRDRPPRDTDCGSVNIYVDWEPPQIGAVGLDHPDAGLTDYSTSEALLRAEIADYVPRLQGSNASVYGGIGGLNESIRYSWTLDGPTFPSGPARITRAGTELGINLVEGRHSLTFDVVDPVGGRDEVTREFIVDARSPDVMFSEPDEGAEFDIGDRVRFAALAGDPFLWETVPHPTVPDRTTDIPNPDTYTGVRGVWIYRLVRTPDNRETREIVCVIDFRFRNRPYYATESSCVAEVEADWGSGELTLVAVAEDMAGNKSPDAVRRIRVTNQDHK